MNHIGCERGCYDSEYTGVGGDRGVTFTFGRQEILYDLKNTAYIEGDVIGEDKQHGQHVLVDICEEGNIDRVNRILELVHSEAVEMLYPYTKEGVTDTEQISDTVQTPDAYIIEMRVPATMSRTTLRMLSKLIHEFMISRVLYDWMSITHAEGSGKWLEKAMACEREINIIKNTRTGVLRRPAHPF